MKRFLLLLLTTILISGCGGRVLLPTTPTTIVKDGLVIVAEPYTMSLDEKYKFGRDYTNLDYNTSFLLIIKNPTESIKRLFPTLESALVDNLGTQFTMVSSPLLPSLDRLDLKRIYAYDRPRYWSEMEETEEDLKTLYTKERSLRQEIDALESGTATVSSLEAIQKMAEFQREWVLLQEEIAEQKHESQIKSLKNQSFETARFKDGSIFPSATLRGLLIFKPLSDESASVTLMIPGPTDEKGEIELLKYSYEVKNR